MTMKKDIKTYSELNKLKTFKERYEYLKLNGSIGEDTFGFDRYLNQIFYKTKEWKEIRRFVIIRDNGCDLGLEDRKIIDQQILIHHMNPISKNDILERSEYLLNPEYLITTTKRTHNAIHYCNDDILNDSVITRTKNDTCPWKK